MNLERTPREVLREKSGRFEVVIYGRGRNHYGQTLRPTMFIYEITGPGPMDWTTVSFRQADTTRPLRRAWERFQRITAAAA